MFWQEDDSRQEYQVPEQIVDVLFALECRELPVDHMHALQQALLGAAPWLAEDPRTGVHSVHVAGSQNGWERPDPALGQKLVLSRRTKLTLRVPAADVARLEQALVGSELDIDGHSLRIGKPRTRRLSKEGTLFARYVALQPGEETDELRFMNRMVEALRGQHIRVRKALAGKASEIAGPDGPIATRSLMLAELPPQESVALQENGLGPYRLLGCGIFLPHKGIEAVKKDSDD